MPKAKASMLLLFCFGKFLVNNEDWQKFPMRALCLSLLSSASTLLYPQFLNFSFGLLLFGVLGAKRNRVILPFLEISIWLGISLLKVWLRVKYSCLLFFFLGWNGPFIKAEAWKDRHRARLTKFCFASALTDFSGPKSSFVQVHFVIAFDFDGRTGMEVGFGKLAGYYFDIVQD